MPEGLCVYPIGRKSKRETEKICKSADNFLDKRSMAWKWILLFSLGLITCYVSDFGRVYKNNSRKMLHAGWNKSRKHDSEYDENGGNILLDNSSVDHLSSGEPEKRIGNDSRDFYGV